MDYQLVTKEGKRIGLFGMGREDIEEIMRAHTKFLKNEIPEIGDTGIGGLLGTSMKEEEK